MALKETELLNAWLWDKHRTDVQWRRVRLGVLPTKELARMYMTILRWVDAIYLDRGVVYIVEAKLRAEPGALGQLDLYEKLFKQTPEFTAYKEWHIQKVLLTAVMDLNMAELSSEKDVEYELYTLADVNKARMEMRLPIILA